MLGITALNPLNRPRLLFPFFRLTRLRGITATRTMGPCAAYRFSRRLLVISGTFVCLPRSTAVLISYTCRNADKILSHIAAVWPLNLRTKSLHV